MSQEWKQQFEKELLALQQKQVKIARENLARKQMEDNLRVELQRRIDASDQAHKNHVNDFLASIQAPEILTFVLEKVFGGKGVIQPVFTDYSYPENYIETGEITETGFADGEGTPSTFVKEYSYYAHREVRGYLSGIALDIQSEPEARRTTSLFIGFTGSRNAADFSMFVKGDDLLQAPPVTYRYDLFGVAIHNDDFTSRIYTHEQQLPAIRNLQSRAFYLASNAANVLAFKRDEAEQLIPEQAILPQLRSSAFQNTAQQFVQNRVLLQLVNPFFPRG